MNIIISHIAFAREKGRDPKSKLDFAWCDGYECARRDNAAAMDLMQGTLDKLKAKRPPEHRFQLNRVAPEESKTATQQ